MGANLGTSADPVRTHRVPHRVRPNHAHHPRVHRAIRRREIHRGRTDPRRSPRRGRRALLVDNKGDLSGMVEMAREVLGVTVQEIDILDPLCAGTIRPMRFAPGADEARTLTLDAMLGALSADDRRRGETVLEAAIDTGPRRPRTSGPAPAVIAALKNSAGANDPSAEGRASDRGNLGDAGENPATPRRLGELEARAGPLMTGRGLVYLRLDGLDLPRHTTDPAQWSVGAAGSMATLRIAFSYALLQSRRARAMVKAVALTELHLLTAYPEGRAFVDWFARVGRALKTYLLLDSQSARDLADMVALLEQILMAFCFQATGTAEQNAASRAAGRPDPGPRLRAAMAGLQVGQCVARDGTGGSR